MSRSQIALWLSLAMGVSLISTIMAPAAPPSEAEMAARIDAWLAERHAAENVTPAPPADDAEFLRRAWLDLTGSIPPVNDSHDTDGDGKFDAFYGVRGFIADSRPDKRRRLIAHLLTKPSHATHFANLWKNALLPAENNVVRFGGDQGFQAWLQGQFADNKPYDAMVKDLLLATGQANQVGPALYYTALDLKPEELAASTSRMFLGTQIQCAQCHNHPFDHWTRADFWGYAAFFARLQRPAGNQQFVFQVSDAADGEVKFPDTETIVAPQFLGGQPTTDDSRSRRERLAEWLTSPANPFFARAAANRVWAVMFGRGLVHPVDDLGQHNAASHPQLLDELAGYFAETSFDLRRLIRTLATTEAYQRSSGAAVEATGADRPELFARMAVKTLTAEQLYDCLTEAMGGPPSVNPAAGFAGGFGNDQQSRLAFLARFRAPALAATEYESGIPQALSLMNGAMIRQATDIAASNRLIALQAPFLTDAQRVEILFLGTLGRQPRDDEREKFVAYVQSGGTNRDAKRALSDVFWALLNSGEFALNH